MFGTTTVADADFEGAEGMSEQPYAAVSIQIQSVKKMFFMVFY